LRGNDECGVGGRLIVLRALVSAKEEQLILQNRPADRTAPLIAALCSFFCRKISARRQRIAAIVVEGVAVKAIRSGLGDGADLRASLKSAGRILRSGLEAEFLQRVGKRNRQVEIVECVGMDRAIQRECRGPFEQSRDGNADST